MKPRSTGMAWQIRNWSMETPKSPWPARVLLAISYLVWIGAMIQFGRMEANWAWNAASILLVLIWLPIDVYRKRKEWLLALPVHVVFVLGVAFTIVITSHDMELHRRSHNWVNLSYAFLGAVSAALQLFVDSIMERRAQQQMRAFLEERGAAPKRKPVLRFAGKPNAR